MLDRLFGLRTSGTTVRTEALAGATTFLASAYIIFVQPTVLAAAGMDQGAVLAATCIATAVATLIMGLWANYPIVVAPAMGHNFFFAFTVVVAGGTPWQVALGAVAIAGLLFILTAGIGLRERVISSIPDSFKHAITVGIGLLIAVIGLEWAGVIVDAPGTLVSLGSLKSAPVLLALGTLALTAVLMARGVRAALLIGMGIATVVAVAAGLVSFTGVVGAPPSLAPTFLQLDVLGALSPALIDVVFVFFLLALFDSIGTLVGLASRIGLLREDGTLPRARQALMADAVGTVVGAGLGTSTVTAYIESSTGVAAGGRTGLAALVTAALFLLALFFYPLVGMVGSGLTTSEGAVLYPIVAPALVLVGVMMMESVRRVRWEDLTEAIPGFLTMITMPLAFSITDGIAFGFIAYAVLKLATGRGRELSWLAYVFAALFLVRYSV